MPNLKKLQNQFLDGIFKDDLSILNNIVDTDRFSSRQRFQVYQNNTELILTDNLSNLFPVIHDLVGTDFFKHLAKIFIRLHPPTSGDMNDYGSEFPAFLETVEPLNDYPYIPDVARLELFRHQSYLGALTPPLSVEELSGLDDAETTQLRLNLQPHVSLFASQWPVDKIWNMHQDNAEDEAFELEQQNTFIMIFRSHKNVTHWAIPKALYAFISKVSTHNLQIALEEAMTVEPTFLLQNHLPHLIQAEVFQSLKNTEE